MVNDKQCYKCNIILSSKQYLAKHLLICKGLSNSLECHLYNKILSDSSAKCKHLKICKRKKKENSNEIIENNKNEIINFNNITTNYNINLISYNKEQRTIEFDINHMNKKLIYKLTTMYENDAYDHFAINYLKIKIIKC